MPQHGSVTCFSPGNELVVCVLNPAVSLCVLMCCSFVPVFAAVLSHRALRVHSALTASKGGWQGRALKAVFVCAQTCLVWGFGFVREFLVGFFTLDEVIPSSLVQEP